MLDIRFIYCHENVQLLGVQLTGFSPPPHPHRPETFPEPQGALLIALPSQEPAVATPMPTGTQAFTLLLQREKLAGHAREMCTSSVFTFFLQCFDVSPSFRVCHYFFLYRHHVKPSQRQIMNNPPFVYPFLYCISGLFPI